MSKSEEEKIYEILYETEKIADIVLMNKEEIVQLDKRRQGTREAIRQIEKNCVDEKKIYITLGSVLMKMKKEHALELLRDDQVKIDIEINKLRSDQKILVNKLRDLEHLQHYAGSQLKPLDPKEINALKANLPMM